MKNILIYCLFLLALLERVWFDLGPNVELVTTASLLAVLFLDYKKSIVATFVVMAISDLIIGNTNIYLFTWSGFLIPLFFVWLAKEKFAANKTLFATISGMSANLFFFFWTNLGVWLLDSWGMYPKTWEGLVTCYINALPFLKNQLTSTLLFLPLSVALLEFIFSKVEKLQLNTKNILTTN